MNSNIIFSSSSELTNYQIEQIEKKYGKSILRFLIDYLKRYSGSVPEINENKCLVRIKVSDSFTDETYIEQIESYDNLIIQLNYLDYLNDFAKHFKLQKNYVEPEFLFPIASLANGAVYMATEGLHKGKIYVADNGDRGIIYHSQCLEDFFQSLG